MYSEELMTYLYSYNMPSKKEEKNKNKYSKPPKFKNELPVLHVLKSVSVTIPLDFNNEAM